VEATAPGWRRYLAPAAFLLAVTIAVVLIRSGIDAGHGGSSGAPAPSPGATPVLTTTAAATTATTTAGHAARRYWTVRAGDTFGVIAAKTGVSVATIQQLNPTVKSTSLTIGERLRIR
jgi:LysM repeat protein